MLLALLLGQQHHFSLSCVGRVAVEVTSSNDPPLSLPSLIPSCDQSNIARTTGSHMRKPNGYVAGYKSSDPLVRLQLEEIIDPIRVVHVLQPFIPERVVGVYKLLE